MSDSIDVTPPDPAEMAWYELNDIGNAERLKDLSMGKLLWVEDHWIAYDGKRWSAEDGERLAQSLAQDVARHIPLEALALGDALEAMEPALQKKSEERYNGRIEALYKHAILTGNTNKIGGMLAQAKSELAARRDDFDRDTMALNVLNGTLRFVRKGEDWGVVLRPHDLADRITRIAAVEYDPKAPSDRWDKHMTTVLPSADVRAFFQACCGYALGGEITEQCIFLLQGKGGDGKSTTMDVVRQVMGGFGSTADVQTFIAGAQRSGSEASPDLARLAGDTRLVSTGEPRVGAALDEARIKQVTGGQPVNARELHGKPFEYLPKFKVFFECNRKPRISGDDDGIWRRVLVIQFPHQFKGTAIDKRFKEKLLEQSPGVLNWMIEGALAWLRSGVLTPPSEVQEAIDDYRRAANPFGEWFLERVDTRDAAAREGAKDLYDSYKAWCEENAVGDREIMSSTAFGRALSDKQIPKMKGANGRVLRKGARLRRDDELAGYGGPAAMDEAPQGGDWTDADDLPEGW